MKSMMADLRNSLNLSGRSRRLSAGSLSVLLVVAVPLHAAGDGRRYEPVDIVHPSSAHLVDAGSSFGPRAISADGRRLAFRSSASNLVPRDLNDGDDIFLLQADTRVVKKLTPPVDGQWTGAGDWVGAVSLPLISADGRRVLVWQSRFRVGGDYSARVAGWFSYDLDTGAVIKAGLPDNAVVTPLDLSADGRWALLRSDSRLSASLDPGLRQLYRYDFITGHIERVSVDESGAPSTAPNGGALSADGQFACFTNSGAFRRSILLQETIRVDLTNDGQPGDGLAWDCSISANGNRVALSSSAFNLGAVADIPRGTKDVVVVRDINARATMTVSNRPASSFHQVVISADGSKVALASTRSFYDDRVDAYVATVEPYGRQLLAERIPFESNSSNLALSATLEHAVLAAKQPGSGYRLLYIVQPGLTDSTLATFGDPSAVTQAGIKTTRGTYGNPISGDGRYIVYLGGGARSHPLLSSNNSSQVLLRDMQTVGSELISVSDAGEPGNGWSTAPSISADGQFVAFTSTATNFTSEAGPVSIEGNVFLRDRHAGTTRLVSRSLDGKPAGYCGESSISGNGRFVAFVCTGKDLVAETSGLEWQHRVYLFDRMEDSIALVSRAASGAPAHGRDPTLSHDGSRLAFFSFANDIVNDDRNPSHDIFVYGRDTGETIRASVVPGEDGQTSHDLVHGIIAAGGDHVVFGKVRVGFSSLYIRDLAEPVATLIDSQAAYISSYQPEEAAAISSDGRRVAYIRLQDARNWAFGLEVLDRSDGRLSRIEPPGVGAWGPVFASDGTHLLLSGTTYSGTRWPLFRTRVDTFFQDGFEF